MIDKKKLKRIHDKTEEAMIIMAALDKMQKRNMRYNVEGIVCLMQNYYNICDELKDLINEQ